MADERKTNGRRAKPHVVKTKTASFKIAPDQYDLIAQRADQCGVRLSVWMRLILLQAATRPVNNGHIHIRQPDGTVT